VEISKPFYLGVHEVTQEQYKRVMGNNPSWFSADGGGMDKVKGMDTRRFPVESVSWEDAAQFCKALLELPEEKEANTALSFTHRAEEIDAISLIQ
jgi:formylglycine-generating enzyme required for sulfatase activity